MLPNHPPLICICLVIYKRPLFETPTWMTLIPSLKRANLRAALFVQDNSPNSIEFFQPKDNHFLEYEFTSIEVKRDPTNPGVSTAYNRGADYAQKVGARWVVLFDQDSSLPESFFCEFLDVCAAFPKAKLMGPTLICQNTILSPCRYFMYRGSYLKTPLEPGKNALEGVTLLNSGLIIDLFLYLQAGGYKESVPLDFSDFIFIDSCRPLINSFYLLNSSLQHSLSSIGAQSDFSRGSRLAWYLKGALGSTRHYPLRAPIYLFYGIFRIILTLWRTGFSRKCFLGFKNTLCNGPGQKGKGYGTSHHKNGQS